MFGLSKAVTDIGVMAAAVLLFIVAALFGFKWADTAGALKWERVAHGKTSEKLLACDRELIQARKSIEDQNANVDMWKAEAKLAQEAAVQAQADARVKARRYESTIARLRATPPPVAECPSHRAYVKQYLEEERGQ